MLGLTAQHATATRTTYQAEPAALSGGAVAGTDHTGYTGTGFVEGCTDADTVSAAAGTAPVALRYANGTTAS